MPSVVQVVSATSAASQPSAPRVGGAQRVGRARCGVRSGPSCGPPASSRSSSSRGGLHGARGQRPVGARVQVGEPRERRGTRRADRRAPRTARIPRMRRSLRSNRCRTRMWQRLRAAGTRSESAESERASCAGRGAPRARVRRLRRAVALVGGRARGVLGRHLGVLRRARLEALRAGARLARDAGRAAGSRAPS